MRLGSIVKGGSRFIYVLTVMLCVPAKSPRETQLNGKYEYHEQKLYRDFVQLPVPDYGTGLHMNASSNWFVMKTMSLSLFQVLNFHSWFGETRIKNCFRRVLLAVLPISVI